MRAAGVLLHITSLPSAYGIGDLGPQSYAVIDFLQASNQRYWQILPINPTDGINAHSPYSCASAFAGNPLLISPQVMVIDGLLPASALKEVPAFPKNFVDYEAVKEYKEKLLGLAFKHWERSADDADYRDFCKSQAFWLDDYAIYAAAKRRYRGQCWRQWPQGLRMRRPSSLKSFTRSEKRIIEETKFVQYVFFSQWRRMLDYAHEHGVAVIGDIPIYVNYDSADVWCHQDYFKLNEAGDLKFVSGCPPDYFSKTGQRWGNPVYDWAALKKDRYGWWVRRVAHNLSLFDVLRIDHFRGFESFWQIPAHERLAVFGRWIKAPGKDFFSLLRRTFKSLPIIAEDLGEITPEVINLMKTFNFPGMRVLLFAFGGDPRINPHMPANYSVNTVAYTGTHDNNTIVGWVKNEAKPYELVALRRFLETNKIDTASIHWKVIEALMASRADTVIVPLSDVLGKGQEGRMNLPSTTMNNWRWRFRSGELTGPLARKLRDITVRQKRG